ncbi:MAG TPA: SDR family NAD(P)-dependent oxidoreductase [Puia sp.]|nr:SDR family NAD(P)-dependent oxidoreductase [Puia sp.]
MTLRFSEKHAVVTGAAMGIGEAVALRLGQEGAKLSLLDVNETVLKGTVVKLAAMGLDVDGYSVDVSDEGQMASVFQRIEVQKGPIGILVHAAGIVGPTSTKITNYSTADFDHVYHVNLKGTFLAAKYALLSMEKTGKGRVLLIASIAGKEGNPGMVGYSSTKAGVIGLVKGIAKEYATTGITINGLAPAVIQTPMNRETSAEQLQYMLSKIPMQRIGNVQEVAAMTCFIVSDENSFSTGFVFDISGGRATY